MLFVFGYICSLCFIFSFLHLIRLSTERKSLVSRRCPDAWFERGLVLGVGGGLAVLFPTGPRDPDGVSPNSGHRVYHCLRAQFVFRDRYPAPGGVAIKWPVFN